MFFFLPGCKSTAKQKTTHPFELTWAVIKTLVMVHYAGCLKGILITAYFNLYTTGWHNPQCLYIRYIYLTQPTRTSSSSKGSLSDTNPNFIHHYQKKSPQILPYMSCLFDLPPKCFPIEFHPTHHPAINPSPHGLPCHHPTLNHIRWCGTNRGHEAATASA